MEQEGIHEEEISDEIPLSLLNYFETSRSRAVVCERLIMEDPEDLTELDSVVDFTFSEDDQDSLNEINNCLDQTNTEALSIHSLHSDDEADPDVEEVPLNGQESNRSEGYKTERDKRLCEELKIQEKRQQRETEFEEELRRLEQAERLQQAELEMKVKKAQEKLDQEMLLQQKIMEDLKRRVEEHTKKRIEEQMRFKQEQEKRREEERRKTEQMRDRQQEALKLYRTKIEKVNVGSEMTENEDVKMDGFRKQNKTQEKEQIGQNNNEQQTALRLGKEISLKIISLEISKDDTAYTRDEIDAVVERKQMHLEGKMISRIGVTTHENQEYFTKEEIQEDETVKKEWDKTKQSDGEERKQDDKMAEPKQSKDERLVHQEVQEANCDFQNKMCGKEEEKRPNCEENKIINKMEIKETKQLQAKSKVESEKNDNTDITLDEKNAMTKKQNLPNERSNKKILISCNFLRNSFKFRQKMASEDNSKSSKIDSEKGSFEKMSSSSNVSQNLATTDQERHSTSSIRNTNMSTAKDEENSSVNVFSSSNTKQNMPQICQDTKLKVKNLSINHEEGSSIKMSSIGGTSQNMSTVTQEILQSGYNIINPAEILKTGTERKAISIQTSVRVEKSQNVSQIVKEKIHCENIKEVDISEIESGTSNLNSSENMSKNSVSIVGINGGERCSSKSSASNLSQQNRLAMGSEITHDNKFQNVSETLNEEEEKSSKASSNCEHSMIAISQENVKEIDKSEIESETSSNLDSSQKMSKVSSASNLCQQKKWAMGSEVTQDEINKFQNVSETLNEEEEKSSKASSNCEQSMIDFTQENSTAPKNSNNGSTDENFGYEIVNEQDDTLSKKSSSFKDVSNFRKDSSNDRLLNRNEISQHETKKSIKSEEGNLVTTPSTSHLLRQETAQPENNIFNRTSNLQTGAEEKCASSLWATTQDSESNFVKYEDKTDMSETTNEEGRLKVDQPAKQNGNGKEIIGQKWSSSSSASKVNNEAAILRARKDRSNMKTSCCYVEQSIIQSENKINEKESAILKHGENDLTSLSYNSLQILPATSKEASQQIIATSQMSSFVNTAIKTSSNCNPLYNTVPINSNKLKCSRQITMNENRNYLMQNGPRETPKHDDCYNNNQAAILETRNEEESSSNVTPSNCDSAKMVDAICQDTKQNIASIGLNTDISQVDGGVIEMSRTCSILQILTNSGSTETKQFSNIGQESTHKDGKGGKLSLCLPERTEEKRLKWMRECVPWSTLQNKRTRPGPSRRGPRRGAVAGGALSLPPLSPHIILQTTGHRALNELTVLTLEDVPGCSLSTLSQCVSLQSLSLTRCGLRALDHINQLQHLRCINVQENEISLMDCENMKSLRVLCLSHNKLTSVHGLTGADNLTVLDLSHNHIRRIVGVESLRRLQVLSVSHNELISSKGLVCLSFLMDLNLSQNHLDSVQDLDQCGLLCSLDLSGNSLTEVPDLKNQVLLRDLNLNDNSVSSLQRLTEDWLPMMQHLSVAQNSLTELPCMSDFVSLETLDLRFNCISELSGLCESLKMCRFIRDIKVDGNPLQQETDWRSTLQRTVPGLRCIDGQSSDPPPAPEICYSPDSFISLCQSQIQQITHTQRRHSTEISAAVSPLDLLKITCLHLDEVFHLSEEHRFQHEFGDTQTPSQSHRENASYVWTGQQIQNMDHTNAAVALIEHTQDCTDQSDSSTNTDRRERAATVIQACWRGVSLRRRLRAALSKAECPDGGWDEGFEGVDLDEFEFDESSLETAWSVRLYEDFSVRHVPVMERPSVKTPDLCLGQSVWVPPPVTEFRPKQAWTSEQHQETVERTTPTHSNRSRSPPSPSVLRGLSERSEKIVEEWGFTDSHTALLMLKRAKKMKSKKEQQQKLKDPNVRLAMFKSCMSQKTLTQPQRLKAPANRPQYQADAETETDKQQRDPHRPDTERTHSKRFLPEMSWDILNGGRVQLVADPGSQRLDSQSCPGISSNTTHSQRHRKELPVPKRVSSAPVKKERISFRDNKVQLSGGWGCGKKRINK